MNVVPGMPGYNYKWSTGWLTQKEKEIISFWTYHRLNFGKLPNGDSFVTTWGDAKKVGLGNLERRLAIEQKLRKGY
jgi:hypothetical protein